jgi:hypothetical protein
MNHSSAEIKCMLNLPDGRLAAGRLETAAMIYERVMESAPSNAILHHVLGLVYPNSIVLIRH